MGELREAVSALSDAVAADLYESEEAYLLVIDLPGVSADATTVSTAERTLHIRADRKLDAPADTTVIRRDRTEHVSIDLPVPPDADAEAATASITDGVLEITIPRSMPETTIPIEDE